MTIEIFMIVGFCLAAYSIVGNDVPQTLGTFISSNTHRPWWVLWLYTSSILAVVLMYGWWTSGIGDASYGRLETIPFPEEGITWLYIVPPILLILEIATWGQLNQHQKPMILYNVNGFYNALINQLDHAVQEGFLPAQHRAKIVVCEHSKAIFNAMKNLNSPSRFAI